jgi:HemX protein
VNIFLTSVIPLGLLVGYSVLIGLWNAPCHAEGRKRDHHLVRAGNILTLVLGIWWVGFALFQGVLPIASPGQLLATVATFIWLGATYAQYRVNQRKLTIIPLAAVVILFIAAVSMGMGKVEVLPENLVNPRASVHIAMSLSAVTLLLGSGVFGAGEIILHKQIKSRTFGQWFHDMPSMSDLNRLRRVSLTAGWILITISVAMALGSLVLMPESREVTISHLHPMLVLWVTITSLWAADRFHWIAQQKLAVAAVGMSALMVLLLIVSVIGFFARHSA